MTSLKKKFSPSRLLVSDSYQGADMFYATAFRAHDPFAFVEHRGKKTILLNDLEIDRGRSEAAVDAVISYSALAKSLERRLKRKPTYAETLASFVKKYAARRVIVPENFPLALARGLEKKGLSLNVVEEAFFPERSIKSSEEIKKAERALRITEAGMERAHEILKATTFGKRDQLLWGGKVLTSEKLRQEVEIAIYYAGGISAGDSIIAGGEQACDPHEKGHGALYGHQLIVLDLFPRDAQSGFYGDLSRTVVRGKPSEGQRHLWETCLQGQKLALKKLQPGASGGSIHQAVEDFFTTQGYPTKISNGRWSGFFHGTGHGLGLELHESPRFGAAMLTPGHLFTIEPGLYIPGLGGVRHEDVIVITKTGYRLLSRFPKMLEL